ncbi:hypothetical protein [Kordia sp.]|uniref:hypothetical protein n=1 Tax=Kordia sp. TaxID=1965332 RepID=UPI003B5C20C2
MMQRIIFLLFFISSFQVLGQRNMEISVNDYNNDKVVDTLKTFYVGGSGFGGMYVQMINGKTNETYELTNDGCFCEIKNTVLVSPTLNKAENKPFLEIMKAKLLPEKRNVPDASLDWIIKSSYSNRKLDDHKFFDLVIDPKNKWQDHKIEYPKNYYIETQGDTLTRLYTTPYEAPEWLHKKETKGFLVYYAHNHYRSRNNDTLQFSNNNQNKLYKVYNTSHGVLVKKGKLHKWVFISDVSITDAPEKLRWESIQDVKLFGNYLFVQQNLSPMLRYNLYVINIETGILGRLKFDLIDRQYDGNIHLIQNNSITVTVEQKRVTYKLEDIFKELEMLYIADKK